MFGRDHPVPAVEIQASLARYCIDPDVFAALDDERKLLVSRDLIVIFDVDQVF